MSIVVLGLVAMAFYVFVTLYGGKVDVSGRVVVCIPVYGQSLALGEEAVRITDFDSLGSMAGGRIVTENLDHRFGFFDLDSKKQLLKKLLRQKRRSFELSVYGMAEVLVNQLGQDTLVCIFPGGQGTTCLASLGSDSHAYKRFIDDIKHACHYVQSHGGTFVVPAICWMQGESDIADYPDSDYRQLFAKVISDLNRDVMSITQQADSVRVICYQTNALSRGNRFNAHQYQCDEMEVPQTMVEMLRSNNLFWASGPTYIYRFGREAIHIDGVGQKRLGYLEGLAALSILRDGKRFRGLIPLSVGADDSNNSVIVRMNVSCPPLQIDTLMVRKVNNFGFSVVNEQGMDLTREVSLSGDSVIICCTDNPVGCKVRYAVNGEMEKSGNQRGPRGNLRDSQGDTRKVFVCGAEYPLHNWCYQFEEIIK